MASSGWCIADLSIDLCTELANPRERSLQSIVGDRAGLLLLLLLLFK
jgi:hypothetical protein